LSIDDVYLINRKQSINQTVELDGETFPEFHMIPVEIKLGLETRKDYLSQLVVKLVKKGEMIEQTKGNIYPYPPTLI